MATLMYSNQIVFDSAMAAYWGTQTVQTGTTMVSTDPGVVRGSLCSMTFSRAEPTGVREDLAQFDFHFTVNAGLGVFSTLDGTDAGVVETALDTMWTTIKALTHSHIVLSGYVWRHWGADYALGKTGLSKPGPTWRTTARSVAGTVATATLPDQVAESVTFITPSRRHWGRIYLPPLSVGSPDTTGRIPTGTVDSISGAVRAALNDLSDNARSIEAVVWSPKYRGFCSISKIQMDNTFDVIRSRRAKQTTYRKTYTS